MIHVQLVQYSVLLIQWSIGGFILQNSVRQKTTGKGKKDSADEHDETVDNLLPDCTASSSRHVSVPDGRNRRDHEVDSRHVNLTLR